MSKHLRIPKKDWENIYSTLKGMGFIPRQIKNSIWSFEKGGTIVTLYPSGILAVDKKDTKEVYQKILELIKPIDEIEIGCDEAGKGDVFGPLVVCCAVIKPENYVKVLEIAPKDSKKLADNVLLKKAQQLQMLVDHRCKIIPPKELNELYKSIPNLNRILDKLYLELIKELRKDYEKAKIYVDAYSHTNPFGSFVIFEHKAEEHVSVSVASMIARSEFLKWLLERNLPKGSSKESMQMAKQIYRKSLKQAESTLKVFFIE